MHQEGLVAGERKGWPRRNEYAIASYELALAMQKLWGSELDRFVGLNLNFFRAPNQTYWKKLPVELRKSIRGFCVPRARELVEAIAPKLIAVVGFFPIPGFERGQIVARRENGARLIQEGRLWGFEAVAISHLTGRWSRPNSTEATKIAEYFRQRL